jgi:hypothetical protein
MVEFPGREGAYIHATFAQLHMERVSFEGLPSPATLSAWGDRHFQLKLIDSGKHGDGVCIEILPSAADDQDYEAVVTIQLNVAQARMLTAALQAVLRFREIET